MAPNEWHAFPVVRGQRWFTPVVLAVAIILVAICCAAAYLVGLTTGRASRTIKTVTAETAAKSMFNDDFYSLYADSTLLVTGSVASVQQTGEATLVNFVTGSGFGATCQVDTAHFDSKPGTVVTFVTQAEASIRQPDGILLTGCVQP